MRECIEKVKWRILKWMVVILVLKDEATAA